MQGGKTLLPVRELIIVKRNDMTPQEFWNKYINENILDIFDITCDFFSGELPGEFLEKYDVGEVILETVGHHAKVKEFERVLKFLRLLKDKQPKLYMENFQYLDDFLVDYYCFNSGSQRNIPVCSLQSQN